ncbi:hypothetical protein PISMIDRAFT_18678 [Pisolithus microcarpus 441]|uniref:Uncharacterized protein n=1 Tax=Pisolithus microcarpus 441 TaxID=765257 RepID=A0A0C9YF66_9AGAM|nr:hypothetical protein PISMIDRAFT_18678 [Pisolithus microcarpus 441]
MADSNHNSSRLWEELTDWLDMLVETSQLAVPPVVLSAASVFWTDEVSNPTNPRTIPQNMFLCESVHLFPQDLHGFHYWISRMLVSERRHLDSRLLVAPGHITRSFVCIWSVVPLFTAVAFHEMDNYPNRAAILRWTAAFEPYLFYWGLLLIPPGYYIDDDGDFVVF